MSATAARRLYRRRPRQYVSSVAWSDAKPFDAAMIEHLLRGGGWRHKALASLLAVLIIAVFTVPLFAFRRNIAASLVPVAYLVPIIFVASEWGLGPALIASIVGTAAADFFFFPPLFSFWVDEPNEAVDLLLFFVVSIACSKLASQLRRESEALRRRENDIQSLYDFSRRLAACFTIADLIAAIQQHLADAFGQPATFFVATADGRFEPGRPCLAPRTVQSAVAAMISGIGPPSRSITDEDGEETWLLRAVSSDATVHGVIAISMGAGSRQTIDDRTHRLETMLNETATTLQRIDIGNAMHVAAMKMQAQLLRDAFHGTLSHELCSPLAAIKGSASVLKLISAIREDTRAFALVEAIAEESGRLEDYIGNLLSATRVTAGGLSPRREWADPRDIIDAAMARKAHRLGAHVVETQLIEPLPLVYVDSGLIEEACGQILENAAKYAASGSTISIRLQSDGAYATVLIADQGVGITTDELQQLGHRSFRSPRVRHSSTGCGLGFWIASTFVHANGGSVSVQSPGSNQGTTVRICLPAFKHCTIDGLPA